MSDLLSSHSPNAYGLRFHHFGLAVAEPGAAKAFLGNMGYRIGDFVFDPLQNVHLAMCWHETMPAVEVIYPGIGAGPLDKLLSAARDGLVYHLCFVTDNLDATLDALEAEDHFRIRCVSDPKPAVLFDGLFVSFYFVTGVGLIEIIDQADVAVGGHAGI